MSINDDAPKKGAATPQPADLARRFRLDQFEDGLVPDPATNSIARIFTAAGGSGSPVRYVITGSSRHTTGCYPSAKTALTQHYEGLGERAAIHEAEIHPQIVDYQSQPFRLEFVMGRKRRTYVPDQIRQYVDGSVEVIEAKSDPRGFKDAEYIGMLDHVEELLAMVGWQFRRVTPQDVFASPVHQRNVELVQSRRFTAIAPLHLEVVAEAREAGELIVPYGELAEAMNPREPLVGRAVIQALMVRREVHIDLKGCLHDGSAVWILPAPAPFNSKVRF